MIVPGEIVYGEGPVIINDGRAVLTLIVVNTGDRPVQVGSHYHFAEANAALDFDRRAAWGHRLAVPAGTAVRFEPGVSREVDLVALGGRRIVPGLRGLAGGALDGRAMDGLVTDDSAADDSATDDSATDRTAMRGPASAAASGDGE